MRLFLVSIFFVNIYANTALDIELRSYIKRFNYKSVQKPTGLNQSLFKLGESLFDEKLISGNKNISCASCHDTSAGTSDLLPLPIGEGGKGVTRNRVANKEQQIIPRNSPSLFNLGHKDIEFMFWDGRVRYNKKFLEFSTPEPGLNGEYPDLFEITDVLDSALSAQALFPPTSHAEMRGQPGSNDIADASSNTEVWSIIMKRLMSDSKYKSLFQKAYPSTNSFNIGHFAKALAHFQKHSFAVYNTPWDNYLRGDLQALTVDEKRGAILFSTKGRCAVCHNGALLGGTTFHNVVSPQIGPGKDIKHNDEGRYYVTKKESDKYLFKTPMLRNVKYTAPYFHSGAFQTLDQVIDHYALGANGVDKYNSDVLIPFESKNYKTKLFVETDSYMLFRKKETAHPSMRSHAIKLTRDEKRLIRLFLVKSLSDI